jgi:hypothetical protein
MKNRVKARDREAFALRVREVVFRRADGRVNPDDRDFYELVIDRTKCGPLYLHVSTSESSALGFVAGRFLHPDRAVAVLGADGVNKHSGKWNFHYWESTTVDYAVADFEWSLKRVLPDVGDAIQGTASAVTDGGAE